MKSQALNVFKFKPQNLKTPEPQTLNPKTLNTLDPKPPTTTKPQSLKRTKSAEEPRSPCELRAMAFRGALGPVRVTKKGCGSRV